MRTLGCEAVDRGRMSSPRLPDVGPCGDPFLVAVVYCWASRRQAAMYRFPAYSIERRLRRGPRSIGRIPNRVRQSRTGFPTWLRLPRFRTFSISPLLFSVGFFQSGSHSALRVPHCGLMPERFSSSNRSATSEGLNGSLNRSGRHGVTDRRSQ